MVRYGIKGRRTPDLQTFGALQRLLGLATPRYLHVPVVVNPQGEKLSKQTGAQELDLGHPLRELSDAAQFLGLPTAQAKSTAAPIRRRAPTRSSACRNGCCAKA